MAEKRSPQREAGGAEDDQPAAKAQRQDDSAALDASVLAKLQELYDSGICTKGDVDERAMQHLKNFPPQTAIDILEKFKNCDLSNVRNRSAYLSGVMTRFRKPEDGGSSAPGGGGGRGSGDGTLPAHIQRRMETLQSKKGMAAGALDQRCFDALSSMTASQQTTVLDQLENQDLGQIRNPAAWFMSVIKRVNRGELGPGSSAGGGGGGRRDYNSGSGAGSGMGGAGMPGAMPFNMGYVPPPRAPPPRGMEQYSGGMPVSGGFGGSMPIQGMPGMPGMPGIPGMMGPGGFNPLMPAPPGMPGMPGAMPGMMGGMGGRDHSMEQMALGVRVDEFHNLSMHAPMVHAAPALKLQQLWDEGCRLVSLLDDRAWEALASLGAPESLVVIEEVSDMMIRNPDGIRNLNAFFMSVANKYLRPGGERPGAPSTGGRTDGDRGSGARPGGRDGGGSDRPARQDGPGDFSQLAPAVRQKVDALIASHSRYLNRGHFDAGVVNALKQVGDSQALVVLDEIGGNDMGNVRNPPGYMMGIIARHLRGERNR